MELTEQSLNAIKIFEQTRYTLIRLDIWRTVSFWIKDVFKFFGIGRSDIFASSMALFNDLLVRVGLHGSEVQLYVSACCQLVTLTYYDVYAPDDEDWIYVSNDSFTKEQLVEAMMYIATLVEGKIRYVTAIDILDQFVYEEGKEYKEAKDVACVVYMMDAKYYVLDPYILAKACLFFIQGRERDNIVVEAINQDLTTFFTLKDEKYKNQLKIYKDLQQYVFTDNTAKKRFKGGARGKEKEILPVSPKYKELEKLGEGVYGSVTLVQKNHKQIALKSQSEDSAMYIELHVLSSFKHENVLGMYNFHFYKNELRIELEPGKGLASILRPKYVDISYPVWKYIYLDGGDLQHTVPMEKKMKWMREICKGIEYLNSVGVIHRDIKVANVIIVDDVAKVADFGISYLNCLTFHDKKGKTIDVYTYPYRPIELIYSQWVTKNYNVFTDVAKYSFEKDVWATGVTLLEIITEMIPFVSDFDDKPQDYPKKDDEKMMWSIAQILGTPPKDLYNVFPFDSNSAEGTQLKLVKDVNLRACLLGMLYYDPHKRIRMKDIKF